MTASRAEPGGVAAPQDRPRGVPWQAVLGVALILLGLTARQWMETRPLRHVFLFDRLAELDAEGDGTPRINFQTLDRERWEFIANLRAVLLALGGGIVLSGFVRKRGPGIDLSGPLLGALLLAGKALYDQGELAIRGAAEGLFSEDEAARQRRFYDFAVAPAAICNEITPPDAKLLISDFHDPQVLKKFGYLVFPRRVYMMPHPDHRIGAAEVRRLLVEHPLALEFCRIYGYTHAVDLDLLTKSLDASAIVPLREGG
jgi:hypothetical protein